MPFVTASRNHSVLEMTWHTLWFCGKPTRALTSTRASESLPRTEANAMFYGKSAMSWLGNELGGEPPDAAAPVERSGQSAGLIGGQTAPSGEDAEAEARPAARRRA